MTLNLARFEERLNVYDYGKKDYYIEQNKQLILNNFNTHPSYQLVEINDLDRDVHVIDDNTLTKNPNRKVLLSKPNETIDYGDYVLWNGYNWLVINIDDNTDIQYRCEMYKCNVNLNFLDKQGSIRTYPCVYRISSRTEKDTTENKYIEVVTGDAYVIVNRNEFTDELSNYDGTRFIFSKNECYTLKNSYNELENGLVYIKLEQSEINFDTDKLVDLGDGTFGWIADYENRDVFEVVINQSDSEVVTGNTLQLTAEVLKNGQVVDEEVSWSSDNENVATVDEDGLVTTIIDGVANITALLVNNASVSDSVQITATTSVVDNYSIQFTPDAVDILLGSTLEVNTKLLNNGVDTTDAFTYSVVGGTALISDYSFNIVDGNNFTIENNNHGGTVIIRCISGIHSVDRTYNLKYLW